MEASLFGYIGAFIAVAIMLGIGTMILGGSATECSGVDGYVDGGTTTTTNSTGWALQCIANNEQSQNGYNLLMIVLIVISAVIVLTVVRMLS